MFHISGDVSFDKDINEEGLVKHNKITPWRPKSRFNILTMLDGFCNKLNVIAIPQIIERGLVKDKSEIPH